MQTVDFIFVNTERNIAQILLGDIITGAEHGEDFNSHMAVRFPYINGYGNKIVEALANGVVFSDPDKYDIDPKIAILTIDVTDDEYKLMSDEAVRLTEKKYAYGWKSDFVGFISDFISRRLARWISILLGCDTDEVADCSETATLILRKKASTFCCKFSAAQITPEFFFNRLLVAHFRGLVNISKAIIPDSNT